MGGRNVQQTVEPVVTVTDQFDRTTVQETKPAVIIKPKEDQPKREFKDQPTKWGMDPHIRERLLHLRYNLQQGPRKKS